MIVYKQGNLVDTPDGMIVHGVNCQGKMAAGVAKAVAQKWPEVKREYLERHKEGTWKPGCWQAVPVDGKLIINLATQLHYGYTSVYVDYYHMERGLRGVLRAFFDIREVMGVIPGTNQVIGKEFSMPMIGTGLGGGDWGVIERIVERVTGSEWTANIWTLKGENNERSTRAY